MKFSVFPVAFALVSTGVVVGLEEYAFYVEVPTLVVGESWTYRMEANVSMGTVEQSPSPTSGSPPPPKAATKLSLVRDTYVTLTLLADQGKVRALDSSGKGSLLDVYLLSVRFPSDTNRGGPRGDGGPLYLTKSNLNPLLPSPFLPIPMPVGELSSHGNVAWGSKCQGCGEPWVGSFPSIFVGGIGETDTAYPFFPHTPVGMRVEPIGVEFPLLNFPLYPLKSWTFPPSGNDTAWNLKFEVVGRDVLLSGGSPRDTIHIRVTPRPSALFQEFMKMSSVEWSYSFDYWYDPGAHFLARIIHELRVEQSREGSSSSMVVRFVWDLVDHSFTSPPSSSPSGLPPLAIQGPEVITQPAESSATLTLTLKDGSPLPAGYTVVWSVDGVERSRGVDKTTWTLSEPGVHLVQAQVLDGETPLGVAEHLLKIRYHEEKRIDYDPWGTREQGSFEVGPGMMRGRIQALDHSPSCSIVCLNSVVLTLVSPHGEERRIPFGGKTETVEISAENEPGMWRWRLEADALHVGSADLVIDIDYALPPSPP